VIKIRRSHATISAQDPPEQSVFKRAALPHSLLLVMQLVGNSSREPSVLHFIG
jgi:hypothetical protein